MRRITRFQCPAAMPRGLRVNQYRRRPILCLEKHPGAARSTPRPLWGGVFDSPGDCRTGGLFYYGLRFEQMKMSAPFTFRGFPVSLCRMLTIRFQRTGRKNDPAFRIVVLEKARSPKAGNPLQVLGSYNPKTKHTVIDADSVKHWISKGAEISGTVNNLLITKGVIEGKKVNVLGKKHPPAKEEEAKKDGVPPVAAEAKAGASQEEVPV